MQGGIVGSMDGDCRFYDATGMCTFHYFVYFELLAFGGMNVSLILTHLRIHIILCATA